jgi:hypothetical protein
VTSQPTLVAPPRLRDGDDPVAELLRLEADRQDATPQHRAEFVVRAYRRSQIRRQLTPGAIAVLSLLGFSWAVRPQPDLISIGAEPLARAVEAQREDHREPTSLPEVERESNRPEREESATTPQPSARRPKARSESRGGHDKPRSEQRAPVNVAACEPLAHDGRYADAASCYTEIAAGGGISAELALLERSRLESRVLGKKQAALATLDEYDRRFSDGSLFREAALARVEVLSALGDHGATRKQIRAVRDRIPERAVQLALLGARLAIDDGDCEEARIDLGYARDRGADHEQLQALEERCRQ